MTSRVSGSSSGELLNKCNVPGSSHFLSQVSNVKHLRIEMEGYILIVSPTENIFAHRTGKNKVKKKYEDHTLI